MPGQWYHPPGRPLGVPGYAQPETVGRTLRRLARWTRRYGSRASLVGYVSAEVAIMAADYVQAFMAPAGYQLCNVCPPPLRLTLKERRVLYRPSGPSTPCTGATVGCLSAQSIGGDNVTDNGNSTQVRHFSQIYTVGGNDRADRLVVWSRSTPTRPRPIAPPIGLAPVVPRHLDPAIDANLGDVLEAAPRPLVAFDALPSLRALPLSPQNRYGSYDEYDDFRPRWLIPPVRVVLDAGTPSAPVVRVSTTPQAGVRSPAKPADQKRDPGPAAKRAFKLMAMFSEAMDFVEVLYKALPRNIRNQYPRNHGGRVRALLDNWDDIEWDTFAVEFAANEFGDQIWGRFFGMRNQISRAVDPSGGLWRAISAGTWS